MIITMVDAIETQTLQVTSETPATKPKNPKRVAFLRIERFPPTAFKMLLLKKTNNNVYTVAKLASIALLTQ